MMSETAVPEMAVSDFFVHNSSFSVLKLIKTGINSSAPVRI